MASSYLVRRYRDSDAESLHALTIAAIKTVGLAGYSQAQVDAWAARHGTAQRLRERVVDGHVVFVAVDANDNPAAFSLIEPDGHLDQLYCDPAHTRRGLADRVLASAEDYARERNIAKLYTEASELARPAFERAGYSVTSRRDFLIEHENQSVPIHNYAMEKALS